MKYRQYNPKDNDVRKNYHLMISGIAPRPIALVGSNDGNGSSNLAPYSFFNGFGANPPIVGFSPTLSGKTGLPKDTLLNIQKTKEFTISVVTSSLVEQTSLASCEFDSNIDEFLKAGFTKHQSKVISVPGVKESPFIMECKLHKILELGKKPGSGNLILGEILYFHIDDSIFEDKDIINPFKIDQIGRSGGAWYTENKKALFRLDKPIGNGIGFDSIPVDFLNSTLTGNQLAKLASISIIPTINTEVLVSNNINKVIQAISDCVNNSQIEKAWQIILNWKNK